MKEIAAIQQTLRNNMDTIREKYKVDRIGLFGSYVRGDTHIGSDLDVLVEFSDTISLLQLVSLENYLTKITGTKVDVVPKDDLRKELKDAILNETVYL